ncbi:hypothetical protein NUACC26_061760 [Scytonema sp. NUACC26]
MGIGDWRLGSKKMTNSYEDYALLTQYVIKFKLYSKQEIYSNPKSFINNFLSCRIGIAHQKLMWWAMPILRVYKSNRIAIS